MDNELRSGFIIFGSIMVAILLINFILLWKCKPYREFMNALYYVSNPDMAILSITSHVLSSEATTEEREGLSKMADHGVSPAVMALCLDEHLRVKKEVKRGQI